MFSSRGCPSIFWTSSIGIPSMSTMEAVLLKSIGWFSSIGIPSVIKYKEQDNWQFEKKENRDHEKWIKMVGGSDSVLAIFEMPILILRKIHLRSLFWLLGFY